MAASPKPARPAASTPVAAPAPTAAQHATVAPTPAPEPQKHSVTLVLANDGAGGDAQYHVELTDAQIRELLADTETPRYIRLPVTYSSHVQVFGGGMAPTESRWVRTSNLSEVHVASSWTPPAEWEWMSGGGHSGLKVLTVGN